MKWVFTVLCNLSPWLLSSCTAYQTFWSWGYSNQNKKQSYCTDTVHNTVTIPMPEEWQMSLFHVLGNCYVYFIIMSLYTVHYSQLMWDLWWTKWHCGRFLSEHFCIPLPIINPEMFYIRKSSSHDTQHPHEAALPWDSISQHYQSLQSCNYQFISYFSYKGHIMNLIMSSLPKSTCYHQITSLDIMPNEKLQNKKLHTHTHTHTSDKRMLKYVT